MTEQSLKATVQSDLTDAIRSVTRCAPARCAWP